MLHKLFILFNKIVIASSLYFSFSGCSEAQFPSNENVGLNFLCMGPSETMEVKKLDLYIRPFVRLSYWSPIEQDFIIDYNQRYVQDCLGFQIPGVELTEDGAMLSRDGYQNILDRADRICNNKTGGYGTNWDKFVRDLETFPALCSK